jgi:hypothetical protein
MWGWYGREGEQDWLPAILEQVDASIALGKYVGLVWREGEHDWQPARVKQVDASIALSKCVGPSRKGGEAGLTVIPGCQHR